LQNINNPPARELFNESNIPVGVLLEGKFPSVFENRMIDNLNISQQSLITESKPTKMVVIADAGLIANRVNYSIQPPQISELGRDRVANITHGNKEFLLNMIYYLNDDSGIMQLRSRSFELRLLDKVKLREEKARWQWINVLVPILLILLIGVAYNVVRKYRYNRS
jgi:ABC-2 type transport system permease protein